MKHPYIVQLGFRKVKRLYCLKWIFTLCVSLVLVTSPYFYFISYYDPGPPFMTEDRLTCQIPQLDPFTPEAMELLEHPDPDSDMCENIPLLFDSPVDSEDFLIVPLIPRSEVMRMGIGACCYRQVLSGPDNCYRSSNICIPLEMEGPTKVPAGIEFAALYCTRFSNSSEFKLSYFEDEPLNTSIFVDVHYFAPLKPEVDERSKVKPAPDQLNVLVLGVSSVSRNDLIRAMPSTFKFLTEGLGAVDFQGFSKIGRNTFGAAIAPLLFSMTEEEVLSGCAKDLYIDSCPFIWNAFAQRGYRTSFHEDKSSFIASDDSKLGFKSEPADYYNRAARQVAVKESGEGHICNGPRLSSTFLLNYTKKFVGRMDSYGKSYFHFLWSSTLTSSDLLGRATSLDEPLSDLLKWLRDGGYLNKTALVLLSDQGNDEIDDEGTGLGPSSLEAQLPFLFLVFPDHFKQKYPEAYQNLLGNANSAIITTLFDLHQTLLDLLEPEGLKRDRLLQRKLEGANSSLPRGISQFLPIPRSRACDEAGIPRSHCACLGPWQDLPVKGQNVFDDAARYAVYEINALLDGHFHHCSPLSLSKVLRAKRSLIGVQMPGVEMDNAKISYLLEIETEPGKAQFQVQVSMDPESEDKWAIMTQIIRLNEGGNHADCVKGMSIVKFCFCN